jgi:MFS family permease
MSQSPLRSGDRPGHVNQVVLASFIGTTIEWYDFFLYGTAAALVFNKLFFPELDPLTGTLGAYGTFAIGFVARPLGGAIFGHYGDRVGRKSMLVWSLVLMGVATALIGIIPTYASIGFWAPVLLTVVRFAQGIGVGGEWGGAVLMAVEHSGGERRGFHGSWPQMGVPAGSLLSTGVFALVSTVLSPEEFLAWGWRVPFLLSVVLIAIGLFIRLRILETPAFEQLKESGQASRAPLLDVIREHPRDLVVGMGMRFAQNVLFYLFTALGPPVGSPGAPAGVPGRRGILAPLRLPVLPADGGRTGLAGVARHRAGHEHRPRPDVWAAGGLLLGTVRDPRALQRGLAGVPADLGLLGRAGTVRGDAAAGPFRSRRGGLVHGGMLPADRGCHLVCAGNAPPGALNRGRGGPGKRTRP